MEEHQGQGDEWTSPCWGIDVPELRRYTSASVRAETTEQLGLDSWELRLVWECEWYDESWVGLGLKPAVRDMRVWGQHCMIHGWD